jgi:hypothetical protein
MPRYEVSDPTQEGFWTVTDVKDRIGPFPLTIKNDEGEPVTIQQFKGQTYTVAVFTPYLTKLGIQAEAEANTLARKLNAAPAPQPGKNRFQTGVGQIELKDTIKEQTVAAFRPEYCPNAQVECEALAKRLNQA